ncbi:O-antigen ligase [Herbaspirillum sp. YR522]|uniref:O-antigen ligase family protein n=1 Tax=Herbaspirillum sp. YR522 TaxID=1144342 RepID=UPI00026F6551|nr:O-antigen ligase family protein [Herbaspirillum sp. YR522]EJN01785.1 lipid A core-O-antigen ligase-like enyme [Herbaspirillum sp. YR522]
MRTRRWGSRTIFVLFFLFFSTGLAFSKTGNFAFYALVLPAVFDIGRLALRGKFDQIRPWARLWPLYLCMSGTTLAILCYEISAGTVHIKSYDNASRMAMFCLLLWIALRMPVHYLSRLRWSFAIGVVIATVKLYTFTRGGDDRVSVIDFVPIIAYSELVLLLGMFALLAVRWERDARWVQWLLMGGCLVALENIFISQTRGAWVTLPLFLVLGLAGALRNSSWQRVAGVTALALAVGIGLAGQTHTVQLRVSEAVEDMNKFDSGVDRDTSLGLRLQLWKGAWILFREHPAFGVGPRNFPAALERLHEQGVLTSDAANLPHSHNEFLFNMATLGTFGMLGLLAIYAGPFWFFIGHVRTRDSETRRAALMGLTLCLGYAAFGLVDVMLMWRICDIFYPMSMAVFVAIILRRKAAGTRQGFPGSAIGTEVVK